MVWEGGRMEFQSGKNDREEDEAKDKGKGKKGRRGSLKGNAPRTAELI